MVERTEHTPRSGTQTITGETGSDPRQPAVAFVTTEHFVLQGARAATVAESTGRANMFLATVSGVSLLSAWSRQRAGLARRSTPSASCCFRR